MIIRFKGLIALQATDIYLLDLKWKVKDWFGFYGHGFLNSLFFGIFLVIFLISLGTNRWP